MRRPAELMTTPRKHESDRTRHTRCQPAASRGLLRVGVLVHNPDGGRESRLAPAAIISPSGIPSAAIVLRILHPILVSTRCDASPLARIAGPTMDL